MPNKTKILLIRFSSFGDVVQCLSLPTVLKNQFPEAEIHWLSKTDFRGLIETHPAVNKVWTINSKNGLNDFKSIWELVQKLRIEDFSMIYDAHNNLRSHLIVYGLCLFLKCKQKPNLIRRSIFRFKRFLLFNFRINLFQQPFSGQRDLLMPLHKWGINSSLPPAPQLFVSSHIKSNVLKLLNEKNFKNKGFISLAPSAAHELKKWPIEYWQDLVKTWPTQFVILGGPSDHFLSKIAEIDPHRIVNLAGQLSLEESAAAVGFSQLLITNDTGLLHVAEQLGHPAVALMGPAPFGFPSRYESTLILEKNLACKPCSKHGQGPCHNPNFQECLRSIKPQFVLTNAQQHLKNLELSKRN